MASSFSIGKHGRDPNSDFQGFLNDLQDWELSLKDKKHMKQRQKAPSNPYEFKEQNGSQFRGATSLFSESSSYGIGEETVDATSEKELGNEYFKKKQYNEAIECYSRSIAFSPTAVAYANRAIAYLKIKRYQEAEEDCTEALNLDDRYIKAYSRRSTCRKELGKLKEAVEDAEFALNLEPNNLDLKKQYSEYKSLYQKDVLERASLSLKKASSKPKVDLETKVKEIGGTSSSNQEHNKKPSPVIELEDRIPKVELSSECNESRNSLSTVPVKSKYILETSIEELASRAASLALTEASKNIKPPTSAYQFEITWRGFSGDRDLQSRLLKAINPTSLPQIFKNALSGPMLLDIIKCVATFFHDEPDMGIKYLENLAKVPRFNMLLMFLSSKDVADLRKIWDCVFCKETLCIENAEILDLLRFKYFPK